MASIFEGVTWSSTVSGGLQSINTPEECQEICADSTDCNFVTWYDGYASPHSNYCEMFLYSEPANERARTPIGASGNY